MIEKVQFGGSTLIDITTRQWHQCPEAVRNYLANVTYDPSDYSTSQIQNYAPATAVASNTKPIGNTVNGVTYYNEVPNVATPIVSGAVQPLDSLRWINTPNATNVRDIGGWACDGGTVKYGMMFRGGEVILNDRNVLVNQCGIRAELNLRGKNEGQGYIPPTVSPLGTDILYFVPDIYQWYQIANKEHWKSVLRFAFDCIAHNQPVYFHCAGGFDRTGTFACIIEALLGMSQSDIDKEYELSCFASGTGSESSARRRNETEWTALINAIKAVPLEGGLSDSFRNRAVSFVLSLGFTIAEINAFRNSMINGNPTAITVSMDSYTVTKSGSNITFDNNISSVDEFQGYEVNLTPDSNYALSNIVVTIGGVDITDSCVTGTETNINRSITNTLTNCSSSNAKNYAIDGQGYVEDIEAETSYQFESGNVNVTMGGVDITSQVLILIE